MCPFTFDYFTNTFSFHFVPKVWLILFIGLKNFSKVTFSFLVWHDLSQLLSYFIKNLAFNFESFLVFLGICHNRSEKKMLVGFGFPCGSDGKESACNVGDLGSIPGLRRFPGEGNGYPLQYPGLENSIDRGAWWATVHRVGKSRTQLSD